jgi:hypothetical protein
VLWIVPAFQRLCDLIFFIALAATARTTLSAAAAFLFGRPELGMPGSKMTRTLLDQ